MKKRVITIMLSVIIMLSCIGNYTGAVNAAGNTFNNFNSIISYYKSNPNYASEIYYNYAKLKYKNKTKKHIAVMEIQGAYLSDTTLYCKDGKKLKKVGTFHGGIRSISKNKKYIVTYSFVGSGMGSYILYKYNKKSGKYKKAYTARFNFLENADSQTKAEKRAYKKSGLSRKKFNDFSSFKNGIIKPYYK